MENAEIIHVDSFLVALACQIQTLSRLFHKTPPPLRKRIGVLDKLIKRLVDISTFLLHVHENLGSKDLLFNEHITTNSHGYVLDESPPLVLRTLPDPRELLKPLYAFRYLLNDFDYSSSTGRLKGTYALSDKVTKQSKICAVDDTFCVLFENALSSCGDDILAVLLWIRNLPEVEGKLNHISFSRYSLPLHVMSYHRDIC